MAVDLEKLKYKIASAIGLTAPYNSRAAAPKSPGQTQALSERTNHNATSLSAMATKYGSDKGSIKHEYTRFYDTLFHAFRNEPIKFVEMGLLIGGPEHDKDASRETSDAPSVRMWLEYFPKAHIVGSDISDFSWFENERFSFVPCDMDERENFSELKQHAEGAKVIIDDASHASSHQQFGFLELFPALASQGIYIIEDLQWQPTVYEKKRGNFPRTSKLFRNFLRDGFFTHPDKSIEDQLNVLASDISGAFLLQKRYLPTLIDKVLVIHKK